MRCGRDNDEAPRAGKDQLNGAQAMIAGVDRWGTTSVRTVHAVWIELHNEKAPCDTPTPLSRGLVVLRPQDVLSELEEVPPAGDSNSGAWVILKHRFNCDCDRSATLKACYSTAATFHP